MKRAFILVLDSFGIGATADAQAFGDVGSDTLGHIADQCAQGLADNAERKGALQLPNLSKLGLAMAHKESTGRFAPGWMSVRISSALMPMPQSCHLAKILRQVTGKLLVCQCCLNGVTLAISKIASRKS